jgi:hypothetical protein
MTNHPEILDPQFTSKEEARPLVRQAQQHFKDAKRTTIQTMADLAALQDRGAHLLYGESSFVVWAAQTFDGIGESSVKQLCRTGRVALQLGKSDRLDLSRPTGIGTRALRELASVEGDFGTAKMIETYDTAKTLLDGDRDMSEVTVKAALRLLVSGRTEQEKVELEVPEALISEDDDEYDENDPTPADTIAFELTATLSDLSFDLPDTKTEMMATLDTLKQHLEGESTDNDQKWIDSSR